MRVLLDECLPKRFKSLLQGHSALTVQEVGWSSKENGELVELASGRFDVILTIDHRFPEAREFQSKDVALIVLRAGANDLHSLRRLAPSLLKALGTIQPGERIVLVE